MLCQSRWWEFDDLMIWSKAMCQFWHNLGEKPAKSITYSANTPLQHLHIGVIGHQLNQQGGGCGQETTVQHLERWPMYIRSEKFDGEGAKAFQFHCQQKGAMNLFPQAACFEIACFFPLIANMRDGQPSGRITFWTPLERKFKEKGHSPPNMTLVEIASPHKTSLNQFP